VPAGAPLLGTTHLIWRRRLPNRQAGGLANLVQLILTGIGTELGDTLADTVARVHAEMERAKSRPPSLYMILMTALLTPRQIDWLMAQIMKRMPQKSTEVFGAPIFNNVGQVDSARLHLGAPVANVYLMACLGPEDDRSLQVVFTTCNEHVNLATVARDIHNNRQLLGALLDAFEEELAATA